MKGIYETASVSMMAVLLVVGFSAMAPGTFAASEDVAGPATDAGASEDLCAIHPVTGEGYCGPAHCVVVFLITSEPPC